jgi:hypothetical protein
LSGSLSAQQTEIRQAWDFENFRANWCVHFLIAPEMAEDELPRGFHSRSARGFPGLAPAVTMLIQGEPNYAEWVPSDFCSTHVDQLKVGDAQLGSSAPPLNDTQYLGVWLIAASPTSDAADSLVRPSYYVATLRSSNWRLIRLAETALIPVQYAEPSAGKVPESTEDRYRVKMGGTVLTWDGHLAGDSAWVAPPIEQDWWILSSRGARQMTKVRLQPEKQQNVVGTLQILGKDDLAKSLRASPIRMVGPLSWGGTGSVIFSR